MAKRLAFFRQAQTQPTVKSANPHSTGTLPAIGSTIRNHMSAFNSIGNSGNMIHRAAMLQTLSYDRGGSAQVNLLRILSEVKSPKKVADQLRKNFDGVVITMSNIFRRGSEEPGMAELLEQLEIPFYVVGAGIQDEMKAGDTSQISQSVMDMMKVVDKKAALFGVRGVHTKSWLNSVGFESPQAIGCPSMFAYPRNILAIKSPSHYDLILTAGHMLTGAAQKERALTLIRGFKGHRPSYVFQGEPKNYTELLDVPGLWNDAAQTLDRAAVSRYLTAKLGVEVPFRRYFSFTESSAWRVAANQHQMYAGDRIHGGVAAMQVGRPAIVLYSDARVNELAEHHGIPACHLGEFGKIGVDAAVSEHLSEERIEQFHLKYVNSLNIFYESVEGAGLEIADRILIPANLLKKNKSKPGFVAAALKKIRNVA